MPPTYARVPTIEEPDIERRKNEETIYTRYGQWTTSPGRYTEDSTILEQVRDALIADRESGHTQAPASEPIVVVPEGSNADRIPPFVRFGP